MFNKMMKCVLFGAMCALSSQAYSATLNLTNVTWAIDSDGLANGVNMVEVDGDFDYAGFTYVKYDDTDSSDTVSVGDTFTDYSYFTAKDSKLSDVTASLAGWTGTFESVGYSSLLGLTIGTIDFTETDAEMTFSSSSTDNFMTLSLNSSSATVVLNDSMTSLESGLNLQFNFDITDVLQGYVYVDVYDNGTWVDLYDILVDTTSSWYGLYSVVYADADSTVQMTANRLGDITADDIAALAALSGEDVTTIENAVGNNIEDDSFVSYNDGNIDITPVPEPGVLSLMGLAFLGLAGFQRKRKSKA